MYLTLSQNTSRPMPAEPVRPVVEYFFKLLDIDGVPGRIPPCPSQYFANLPEQSAMRLAGSVQERRARLAGPG